MPQPDHSVRLRDGDLEVEISGNPAFVRQVLDDLPVLMARMRGDAPSRTPISMPSPPSPAAVAEPAALALEPPAMRTGANGGNHHVTAGSPGIALEERVMEILRTSSRPLPIAAIRQRLDDQVTGQQVRRLLEKVGDKVSSSSDKPVAYSLR